jgi:hypothetical protein
MSGNQLIFDDIMEPDAATYLPWFVLKEIPGLGNQQYNHLLQTFGSPEQVLLADAQMRWPAFQEYQKKPSWVLKTTNSM